MKRIIRCLLLGSALVITGTGCASWSSISAPANTGFFSSPEHLQIRSVPGHPTIYLCMYGGGDNNDRINARMEKIFKDSGRYEVTHNQATADYQVLLYVRGAGDYVFPKADWAAIVAITLFVIPVIAYEDYEIKIQIAKQDGTVIAERRLSARLHMVAQILLLPFTPFSLPRTARNRMYRKALTEALAWTDSEFNALQK
jgi:hypothetical protein